MTADARHSILLVEDDDAQRELLSSILRAHGYDVQAVADGFDALPIVDSQVLHAIVTDVVTPVFDGARLITYLEATHPDLLPRTIVCTGYSTSVSLIDPSHVAAFLTKPVDVERLLEILRNMPS